MNDGRIAFEKKLIEFSDKNELLSAGDKVLVCLSGGSDSVCLLKVLHNCKDILKIKIYACHVNHMIRGEEADRDEAFCKEICKELNIDLYCGKFDVLKIAEKEKKGTELAAREVRYKFFNDILKKYGIDKIATAHNKNDNAETLLMNYIRGSGLSGMCGIDVKRDNIIRPLLCMEKREILDYLKLNNAAYVTDSTNLSVEYTRNKLRLELIDYIEKKLNPSFCSTVTHNAELIRADNEFISGLAEESKKKCLFEDETGVYIELENFRKLHRALRYRILRNAVEMVRGSVLDIGMKTIERIDEAARGKITVCSDVEAQISYGRLYISKPAEDVLYEYKLGVNQNLHITEGKCFVKAEILEKNEYKKEKNCVYFDYDKICCGQLYVRNRRNGDVIKTEAGTKKLKNLFIDSKIPVKKRNRMPLLVYENEVLWVCGLRRSNKYKINNETKRVIKISCIGEEE